MSGESSESRPGETDTSGQDGTRRRAARDLRSDLVRYLPSQVIPALIAFVTIPVLTRLLSPAEFGEYRVILAVVAAFGAVAGWLPSGVYRFFPEMEISGRLEEFRSTVNRLLAFTLGLFTITWLGGVWALRSWIDITRLDLLLIGGVLMLVNTVWGIASAQVRAVREVGRYSLAVVLNKALTLGIGVALLVWAGLGVEGLLYGSIAASVVLIPLLLRAIYDHLPRPGRFSRPLAREILRYGLPVALVQVVLWGLQQSDRLIIAALRNDAEVGLFSAAYGIAEQGMEAILLMFQLPFSILGSRVWERDGPEAAAEFVSDSARSYLLVAVPAWAGLSILAVPIMTVMTAAPYHEAAGIIPVVSLALLVGAIQWWYTTGATFSKKTGQLLISISAAIVVNVALNLLLVERFGYWAAAWTTLIAYGVAALVMAWLTRRAFRWRFPLASLGRSVLAAGLMSLAIWSIMGIMDMGAATLAVSVPVGIVVYGLALLILGEPQARRMFDRLTRRT